MLSKGLLRAGCCAFVIAAPLGAQTASPSPRTTPAPAPAASDTSAASGSAAVPARAEEPARAAEEIVVTGSRVITNGNNSPTPVTVVTTAQLQQSTPSNIPDALNKLPVFSGSRSQSTINNASSNATGNFLNLRGVGILRTLILFDGHRVPATGQDGTVDTNTIPQLLLQRVDVVTGGASAVYGSDAVTGVVNFVVDKKFNGIKAQAQGGLSQRGDNGSMRFGVAGGQDLFGGRGHVEASYEYYSSDGLPSKLLRRNGQLVYTEQGAGTAASPFRLVANSRNALFSYGGYILATRNAANATIAAPNATGQQFVGIGVVGPFNHGTPTASNGIESGGDGTYFFNSSLTAYLKSHQAFGRFDYDLTDDIDFYAQVSGTQSKNGNFFAPLNYNGVTLSVDNPYLTPAARALFPANATTFTFNKVVREATPNAIAATTTNIFANAGLTGKLGDFHWEAGYTHAQSRTTVINVNNLNSGRYYAALDAATAPNGQIVCRVTLTNPGLYPGCVPLNPFGDGSENPSAISYIRQDTKFRLTNKMDDFYGSIAGSPFALWAGPVQVAVSGEYRKLHLDNISNAQPTARQDCTGLRFNCNANTPLFTQNVIADAHARQSVAEGAVEVDVPLLKDLPLVRSLNLNGAARYTHYTTSGNAKTWKVGLDWHVNDALSFRATRSQDIRAPTLNDLFAPINASPTGFVDTHTKTSGTTTLVTTGNPNLVPEVAQTLTIGGVFRPSFLPRFSIAVDYYRISISKAIASIGGNSTATLAQCEASNGTSPLCALYVRPLPFSDTSPLNYPTQILSQALNVSSVKTHGIDSEVNYSTPAAGGQLSLRGLLTWQPKLVTVQFPGSVPIDAAGAAGLPTWKATAFVHYTLNAVSFDVQERWHSSTLPSGNPQLIYADPRVPAAAFTDLTLSYMFKRSGGQAEVFLSIQNLLDKEAPVWANTAVAGNPGFGYPSTNGDDIVGRYFTAGVRMRF